MNALLGGKNSSHGGGGGGGGGLGSLANQFLGGQHGGGSGGGKSSAGKLVGQLASNFLSPSNKPQQPSNYHGGQTSGHSSQQGGGLAGAVFGGVANMFGGKPSHGSSVSHLPPVRRTAYVKPGTDRPPGPEFRLLECRHGRFLLRSSTNIQPPRIESFILGAHPICLAVESKPRFAEPRPSPVNPAAPSRKAASQPVTVWPIVRGGPAWRKRWILAPTTKL